jgi:hypothetical protein
MVNEACCYPITSSNKEEFDADREIEKLLSLIKIDSSETRRRTRAPTVFQSNTRIPPPARFSRGKNSNAMINRGQARPSTTLALSDQPTPASAHQLECAINAPVSAEFDRIFEALYLDADCPSDAVPSTLALNS